MNYYDIQCLAQINEVDGENARVNKEDKIMTTSKYNKIKKAASVMTYTEWLAVLDEYREKSSDVAAAENPLNLRDGKKAVEAAGYIWAAAQADLPVLLSTSGMTAYGLGRKFDISPRTVQAWANESRKAPNYVIDMMAYILVSELQALKRIWFVQNCYPGDEDLTFFSNEKEAMEYGLSLWDHRSEQEKARYRKNAGGEWRLSMGTIEVPVDMEKDEYWDEVIAHDYGDEIKDFTA